MDSSIVKTLPDDVIKALCNTLIHSLWQGVILAAVAGLIVMFTRRYSSAIRYNLLVASLCLFALGVAYTFIMQLELNHTHTIIKGGGMAQTQIVNLAPITITNTSVIDNIKIYLNSNAGLIVMIWLLVVCARSIQLITGLHGLYHLKRKAIFLADKAWQSRVDELSQKLGINRIVALMESGMASVPMVIGHIKPIILIPIGLIASLSPAEVDAILVHELAHIRRKDYLVNLLQSFMEIVFFFNPAVLWLSTLIKAERENCCDDIALLETNSKTNYIKALVSCQEYQLSAPAFAMAVTGPKNSLLGRVKRMLSNTNQSLNTLEKSLLAICLLTAGLLTTAFSNADKISKVITTTSKTVTNFTKSIENKIVQVKEPAEKQEPVEKHEIKEPKSATVQTVKNGLKIYSPESVGEHTDMEITNGQYTTYLYKQGSTLYQLNSYKGTLSSVQINGATATPDQLPAYQMSINRIITNHNAQIAAKDADAIAKLDKVNLAYEKAMKRELDSLKNNDKRAVPVSPVAPAIPAYSATPINYSAKASEYKPRKSTRDDSLRNAIIVDMIADGIVKQQNHDDLSFKLSTTEFIVNGKKQTDEVYQKYRARYVKVTGRDEWTWYYNYDVAKNSKTERKSTVTY